MLKIAATFAMVFVFSLSGKSQRVTIDFEDYSTGIILSNQSSLTDLGISFPKGIEVVDCQMVNSRCKSGTDGAVSGNKVGYPAMVNEFEREIIVIDFSSRQDSVSFYLKPAFDYLSMEVSIEGWTDGIDIPAGGTATYNNNSFQKYSFKNVDQIRIFARSGSTYNNYIIIDDITFDKASDIPQDTQNPTVSLSAPGWDYTTSNGILPLLGWASDNVQLDTVEVLVFQGETEIYRLNLCGRAGAACPIGAETYNFTTTIDLSNEENGEYKLKVVALDVSGNQSFFSRFFTIEIPDPPPAVSVHKIEINQAVQDRLFDVNGPGNVSTASSSVPLLPERNTLVRFYLKTEEGIRYNYSTNFKLVVFKNDGSTVTDFISPNINGFPEVDSILPMPAGAINELRQLTEMRANMGRTLNFVIEEDLLEDADLIGLTLFDGVAPVSGQLQVNFVQPVEFIINYYTIKEDTPEPDVFMNNIGNYIDGTYPISRLHQQYQGEVIISLGFNLIAAIAGYSEASRYRRALKSAIGGRWPALPPDLEYNYWRVMLGVMHPNAGGNATRGEASDLSDRLFGVASTSSRGNVGAHEAGHLIGLKHAGTAHGECGGGGCEEFVNVNGTLAGEYNYRSDFGIILQKDSIGNFNSFLIDPCPVANLDDRIGGCTADILANQPEPVRPFDFMSYGEPSTWGGFLLDSRSKQWISKHNYKRIYNAIRYFDNVKRTSVKAATETKNTMYMQIEGIIKDDSAYLYGVTEKPLDASVLVNFPDVADGHKLILKDASGNNLYEKYFIPDTVEDTETCCATSFNLFIPQQNFHELVIKNPSGETIRSKKASKNKPSISISSELGGNQYSEKDLVISWEANDADNDPLIINIEYSPDMGNSWVPLAILEEPKNNSITVDASLLPASENAVIKVLATDGIHNATDINNLTFCVNNAGTCNPVPVTLGDLGITTEISDNLSTSHDYQMQVYPNPARYNAMVALNTPKSEYINVSVFDLVGKSVLNRENIYLNEGQNHLTLNIGAIAKGTYHVVVTTAGTGRKITRRLIIQ